VHKLSCSSIHELSVWIHMTNQASSSSAFKCS